MLTLHPILNSTLKNPPRRIEKSIIRGRRKLYPKLQKKNLGWINPPKNFGKFRPLTFDEVIQNKFFFFNVFVFIFSELIRRAYRKLLSMSPKRTHFCPWKNFRYSSPTVLESHLGLLNSHLGTFFKRLVRFELVRNFLKHLIRSKSKQEVIFINTNLT